MNLGWPHRNENAHNNPKPSTHSPPKTAPPNLVGVLFAVIYLFRCTRSGRVLLNQLGRPSEYDDEQAFFREEAEALERMDEVARGEYLRAKGKSPPCLR